MKKLLVFSDIHMTTEGTRFCGRDPLSMLRAALEHALSRHGDAEAILLLGDLTEHGTRAEYARLTEALARISIPILPIPGNHDRRDPLLNAFPTLSADSYGYVQQVLDLPRHRLIMLDTLDGPPYRASAHGGRLCPDRMAWLLAALEGREDRHPVIFTHHPAPKLGLSALDPIRLGEGTDLLELLSEVPGAHLISGHVHRGSSGISRGVAHATIGSTAVEFALSLSGEEIRTTTGPGQYGVVLLPKHGVTVHHQTVPMVP